MESCAECQSLQPSQQKEEMRSIPIPTRPWQIVSSDLFHFESDEYVIVVDHYSHYYEFEKLPDQSAESVIDKCKAIFARNGIPDVLYSDNGPQYVSAQFNSFADNWNFRHFTSSPHHPRGNGTAEAAVKVAKKILTKSDDPYLALLHARNSPDSKGFTPSQKLNSRLLRTTLPIKDKLLMPKTVPTEIVQQRNELSKRRNKLYYDRHAKKLPKLDTQQCVRFKQRPNSSKLWSKGKVVSSNNDRSVQIRSETGREYRRNRIHTRLTHEPFQPQKPMEDADIPIDIQVYTPEKPAQVTHAKSPSVKTPVKMHMDTHSAQKPQITDAVVPRTTRSGRQIKAPIRLDL